MYKDKTIEELVQIAEGLKDNDIAYYYTLGYIDGVAQIQSDKDSEAYTKRVRGFMYRKRKRERDLNGDRELTALDTAEHGMVHPRDAISRYIRKKTADD